MFELPDLKSALYKQEASLIRSLSYTISYLPKVIGNPVLRVSRCVKELMLLLVFAVS